MGKERVRVSVVFFFFFFFFLGGLAGGATRSGFYKEKIIFLLFGSCSTTFILAQVKGGHMEQYAGNLGFSRVLWRRRQAANGGFTGIKLGLLLGIYTGLFLLVWSFFLMSEPTTYDYYSTLPSVTVHFFYTRQKAGHGRTSMYIDPGVFCLYDGVGVLLALGEKITIN
ncbi:hypothetical protein QBC44DRAFT_124130 [Cladorrhinum sp. PSN332]|nr:hypothetical protein QBC44DRAFT_124130 [Cladorrhinum sp. PSN332]